MALARRVEYHELVALGHISPNTSPRLRKLVKEMLQKHNAKVADAEVEELRIERARQMRDHWRRSQTLFKAKRILTPPTPKPQKRRFDEDDPKRERALRVKYAADRRAWPAAARSVGYSNRGNFRAGRRFPETQPEFGPPSTIWHNFGERVFEREMSIPWNCR